MKRRSKGLFFSFVPLIIGAVLGCSFHFSVMAADITDAEIRSHVAEKYGPILSKDALPTAYESIETLFNRLVSAQQAIFGTNILALNGIEIVDSPIINAFVITQKQSGIRRVHNRVFITTALLRKMLHPDGKPDGVPSAEDLKAGMYRIAGILAHELAHPIDVTDSESFKNNFGKVVSSQADEIAADSRGALIAQKAGYPADSLYSGLIRLFEGYQGPSSKLEIITASHPEKNLRLSAQRMFLTLNRYQVERQEPFYPQVVKPAFYSELKSLSDKSSLDFKEPHSLNEALTRLSELPSSRESESFKRIEYNRLLLYTDDLLAAKGTQLSPDERKAFFRFAQMFSKRRAEFPSLASGKDLSELLNAGTGSAGFINHADHFSMLKKAAIYRDPEYQAFLRENFSIVSTNPLLGIDIDGMERLDQLSPADQTMTLMHDRILEALKRQTTVGPEMASYYFSALQGKLSPELRRRVAGLFQDDVEPGLTLSQRLAEMRLTNTNDDGDKYLFYPLTSGSNAAQARAARAVQLTYPSIDPLSLADFRTMDRRVAQKIWDRRGYWGAVDLFTDFHNVDWDRIWSILGIHKGVARSQLLSSVKAFSNSPAYVDFLTELKKESLASGSRSGFAMGMPAIKFNAPTWLDDSLWPYLSGARNALLDTKPELREFSKKTIGALLLNGSYPTGMSSLKKIYNFEWRKRVSSASGPRQLTADDLVKAHSDIMEFISADKNSLASGLGSQSLGLFLDQVKTTPLSSSEKSRAISEVYLGENLPKWVDSAKTDVITRVFNDLRSYGAFRSPVDFIRMYQESIADQWKSVKKQGNVDSKYFSFIEKLKIPILDDLKDGRALGGASSSRADRLLSYARLILDPRNGVYEATNANSQSIREIKAAILDAASKLSVSEKQSIQLFKLVTATGATQDSDRYFKGKLGFLLERNLDAKSYAILQEAADRRRFATSTLQLNVAKKVLGGELRSLESKPVVDPKVVEAFIKKLNDYVPSDSLKKDDYLEEIGWRLKLRGSALLGLIEDNKSYNWKKADPKFVNMGSGLSQSVSSMEPQKRVEFIKYLMNPEGKGLPRDLYSSVEQTLFEEFLRKPGEK